MSHLFRIERKVVVVSMAIMGVVVFADVAHRTASRDLSLPIRVIAFAIAVAMAFGALRMRGRPASGATAGIAALIAVAIFGGLKLFTVVMPNGLIWSQTLGLVLMLWVGVLGASMAAHEHRHLALDLGSKVWPKKALPYVQATGNVVTALLCLALAGLSVLSLRDHYGDYQSTDGAGGIFTALPIPKFIAFAAIPVGFVTMAARFLLQARDGVLKGEIEEDDAMHMLGLDADVEATTAAAERIGHS